MQKCAQEWGFSTPNPPPHITTRGEAKRLAPWAIHRTAHGPLGYLFAILKGMATYPLGNPGLDLQCWSLPVSLWAAESSTLFSRAQLMFPEEKGLTTGLSICSSFCCPAVPGRTQIVTGEPCQGKSVKGEAVSASEKYWGSGRSGVGIILFLFLFLLKFVWLRENAKHNSR